MHRNQIKEEIVKAYQDVDKEIELLESMVTWFNLSEGFQEFRKQYPKVLNHK